MEKSVCLSDVLIGWGMVMRNKISVFLAMGLLLGIVPFSAGANEYDVDIKAAYESKIKDWIYDPIVINALKAQNKSHSDLTPARIDDLDKRWRREAKAGEGELIRKVLTSDISKFLKAKKEAFPNMITEVFVMDNKGLNVGQSDVTSDYMQGDEAKWQKTFLKGPDALFIDEVEFDESSGQFQAQISATIKDPVSGEALGAVTLGINIEGL